jgi:hypothetical protein
MLANNLRVHCEFGKKGLSRASQKVREKEKAVFSFFHISETVFSEASRAQRRKTEGKCRFFSMKLSASRDYFLGFKSFLSCRAIVSANCCGPQNRYRFLRSPNCLYRRSYCAGDKCRQYMQRRR